MKSTMTAPQLFQPFQIKSLALKSRIVMAPQLWHVGIVAPGGSGWLPPARFEGPSGSVAPGKIGGAAMTEHDIAETIRAFAQAALVTHF
jgi:2,4-dienoyl-CoA reductase-like NADH-dependent reductase (Old Yellow Enzyme family)